MARYTGPVCRLCRRERMKLFLKGAKCDTMKCPIEKRPYPPGIHGRGRVRDSEYLLQLREKQKARRIPSYKLRKGDVVSIREKSKNWIVIRHNLDTLDHTVPMWLEVSADQLTATVRDLPIREQIDIPVREQLIVELYSK